MKKIIIIIIVVLTIISLVLFGSILLKNKNIKSSLSVDNIKELSQLYKKRYYIFNINTFDIQDELMMTDSDLLKIAIYDNATEDQYITKELSKNISMNFSDKIYYMKKDLINKYLLDNYNKKELNYAFVMTSLNRSDYTVIDNNNVYYTYIIPDNKFYFPVNYSFSNNKYIATVYEYEITPNNKQVLEQSLETREIPKEIKYSKIHEIEYQLLANDRIKLLLKK